MIEAYLQHSSDGYEPLQARALLELARKIGRSKVARLENARKFGRSKMARLEKCSKNFGSNSTRLENDLIYSQSQNGKSCIICTFLKVFQVISIMYAKIARKMQFLILEGLVSS